MEKRVAVIKRKTREVDIKGKLNIDGQGKYEIKTGFKSLDHMLELFVFHGLFDLQLQAKGDLQHHLVEDVGIALGDAFKKAIGKAVGIRRYGFASVPMDNVLARVSVDISGRPTLTFPTIAIENNLDLKGDDFRNFLQSFVDHAKIGLIIEPPQITAYPPFDAHHLFEAVFKALGIALDFATQLDKRRKGVSSTKGVID